MSRIHACLSGLAIAAVLAVAPSIAAAEAGTDGRTLFESNKCNMCHSVASAGIESKVKAASMKGPDLGGTTVNGDGLIDFMRKKTERSGKLHKNEYKGTDEEFAVLLEWLRQQAAPPGE